MSAEQETAGQSLAGHVTAATYDRRNKRIAIVLDTGIMVQVPTKIVQGLADATPKDLSEIEITPSGLALHWPRLDADLYVPALLRGIVGTRKWMAQVLGQTGGSARTAKKANAARSNGQRGGRPRKAAA